ncbi:MAG TPA: 7TM diverse intracellular signaling domain-containing protein, partial [Cyclobacteriaceae bacterium]
MSIEFRFCRALDFYKKVFIHPLLLWKWIFTELYSRFTLGLILLVANLSLFANEVKPVQVSGQEIVELHATYFLDPSNHVTIQQLLDDSSHYQFTRSNRETLNFGPTNNACWVHFSYQNRDTLSRFLEIANANLNKLDLYVVCKGRLINYLQSGLLGVNSSETFMLNAWLLPLPTAPPGRIYDVYIRAVDQRRVILPMKITDLNSAIRSHHQINFHFGLYFGCLSIIAIMNIFCFAYFKERMYLYYCFHIATQILINGILKGYLLNLFGYEFYFLSPYVPGLAGVSNIASLLFSLEFLDVRKSFPHWNKVGLSLMLLPCVGIFLNMTGFFTLSAWLGTYIGFIIIAYLFALGLFAYKNNSKQARFYLIGWGSFLLGIIILNSALIDLLPITGFTFNAAVFGSSLEVLLISSALIDRVN